MMMIMFV